MKNLIILLLSVFILASCGKKQDETNVDTKKEAPKTQTENKTQSAGNSAGIFPIASVGKEISKNKVPEFSWTENGKTVSLSDHKGKVMLLNFWATWCGPCKAEMPELSDINKELKDKNFLMLGLTVFQKPGGKTIQETLTQIPVSYNVIDGNDDLVKAFESASGKPMEGVPTTYIIDKNGKIVETFVGSRSKDEFLSTIKKYL